MVRGFPSILFEDTKPCILDESSVVDVIIIEMISRGFLEEVLKKSL